MTEQEKLERLYGALSEIVRIWESEDDADMRDLGIEIVAASRLLKEIDDNDQ